MRHELFTIYDSKVCAYGPVFQAQTLEAGKRMFTTSCMDPDTNLNRYPNDFGLYHIGWFDETTGTIHAMAPHHLGVAIEFILTAQHQPLDEMPAHHGDRASGNGSQPEVK